MKGGKSYFGIIWALRNPNFLRKFRHEKKFFLDIFRWWFITTLKMSNSFVKYIYIGIWVFQEDSYTYIYIFDKGIAHFQGCNKPSPKNVQKNFFFISEFSQKIRNSKCSNDAAERFPAFHNIFGASFFYFFYIKLYKKVIEKNFFWHDTIASEKSKIKG